MLSHCRSERRQIRRNLSKSGAEDFFATTEWQTRGKGGSISTGQGEFGFLEQDLTGLLEAENRNRQCAFDKSYCAWYPQGIHMG
jgi:hypothetical protein